MKYFSGQYGKDTIESNSLVQNLLKYPEIAKSIVMQYPQYNMTYFVDGTSRFAKEDIIGDNSFRWAVQGRLNRPSTLTGTNVGNGLANSQFTVVMEENYLNPNDVIRFADKSQAIVIGEPIAVAGGYNYTLILQTTDATKFVAASALTGGNTVGKVGTAFGEHSERGFENHVYPDWYINYLTISRKSKSISGSALTDVTWVENNGQRLWYFQDQDQQMMEFLYELEKNSWYSESTVDANGNPIKFGADGKPIIMGDGVLKQIDSSNVDTYNGTLTEERITDFLAQLQLNTGSDSTHWVVYTGTAGKVAFHKAMKELVYPGGNLVYDAATGQEQKLGVNFTTYSAIGSRITLAHNPLFDDPNLHGQDIDPATGKLNESFKMVFMNMGVQRGVANVERKVKGAGGINRGMIMKYLPGMVNPFDKDSVMSAVNSRDGFVCEMLSESGIIIRNPLSCGMLVKA